MYSTHWMTDREAKEEIIRGGSAIVSKIAAKTPPDYLLAAADLARKGLTGEKGDPLPLNMNAYTVMLINSDIPRFQLHVSLAHKRIFGW